MPVAYATNGSTLPVRSPDTTMARNGPAAQPSEATAYAIPNSTVDGTEPVSRGAGSPRPGAGSDRPASSQTPAAASAPPNTTVAHGSRGCSHPATGVSARPNAANTAT
jgi:hypothetical protein